jgi:hypothetical protein
MSRRASTAWRLFVLTLLRLPLSEIALVPVRLDQLASVMANANHGIM